MAWIALVLIALLVAALVLVLSAPMLARTAAARRDYRQARGTLHRLEIERALTVLVRRVEDLNAECGRLEAEERVVRLAEQQELDRALAEHLVDARLDEAPGVGQARVAAIKAGVFRGNLRDLLAADSVPGIGPQTATAIAAWVRQMEHDWGRLRAEDFSGRREIESEHAARNRSLQEQQGSIAREVARLEGTRGAAQAELDRLRLVTSSTFKRALADSGEGRDELRSYLLGVYPPWGHPPRWYVDLLDVERGEAAG